MSPWTGKSDFYDDRTLQAETFDLNLGPQHPATHGVFRLVITLDGEIVRRVEPFMGYAHRGQEKMGENRTYAQWLPNTSRIDYLSGMIYNHGYCEAVERLCDFEVPPRAKYLRVITDEFNRVASHLMWFGNYLMELGAFTPFLYCWDDREYILDLLDSLTGSRLTYNYNRFGGVRNDLPVGFRKKARKFIQRLRGRFPEYHELCTKNVIFRHRVKGVGVISRELAINAAASGPTLRGSGVEYDLRKYAPYAAYEQFDFIIPHFPEGDALARYNVRLEEMVQSLNILEQALAGLPEGPFWIKTPRKIKPPPGEIYFAVESARGESGFYIASDGSEIPYRIKVRSPSLSNVYLTVHVVPGHFLADLVAILGSIDILVPEIDR